MILAQRMMPEWKRNTWQRLLAGAATMPATCKLQRPRHCVSTSSGIAEPALPSVESSTDLLLLHRSSTAQEQIFVAASCKTRCICLGKGEELVLSGLADTEAKLKKIYR